jgi:crotonobetainyl-CoA:carnitine CoA-transferase CaiB-like acyl-CoA transferase
VLPAPNPIAARPADPITVPASPAPFTAPAAPGARPAPAGAEIDRVLDELAHRLEQAVEDLGLDGEG